MIGQKVQKQCIYRRTFVRVIQKKHGGHVDKLGSHVITYNYKIKRSDAHEANYY